MACEKRDILIKPADEFALPNYSSPNAVRLAINACASDALFLKAMSDMNHLLAKGRVIMEFAIAHTRAPMRLGSAAMVVTVSAEALNSRP